ncbi:hypothetical protein [Moorella sp. Hama-1]|uniref:hypothetical protein n=1 Tax=Moorella sp. Hama-1 TaxID=2138101 RepID=UPI00137AB7D2|nr:hypothetical protein [Moorella sp. Hama-1]
MVCWQAAIKEIVQGGDSDMPPRDFMAMRREVMAEDRILAGRRQAEPGPGPER